MQLLRPHELPVEHASLVARYSPVHAGIALGAAAAAAVLLLTLGLRGSGLPLYLAAVIVASIVLARRMIFARFRTSNWLVRSSGRGLYLQLRSHLNYHFPDGDRTVVFIPYREIRSVRAVRERRTVPDGESRNPRQGMMQTRWLVALELNTDSAILAQALRDEAARTAPREHRWYGSSATKYKHYPITLPSPTNVEVEWKVTPPAEAFVETLRDRVLVAPTEERTTSYLRLETLSRAEQETKLIELVASGQTLAAIKMARLLYSYDLAQAKEFVHGLQQSKSSARAS